MTPNLLSAPAISGLPPTVPTEYIWRLTIAQYHEMVRTGILTADDPVELLEGWLVYKMPKSPPHRIANRLARQALEKVVPEGWYVDAQEPVTILDSEPEPDVVVVRGDTRQYADRHPGPADLALVVEVSSATLPRDRGIKKRVYARAGVPVYWILNLVEGRLEVYRQPSGPTEAPDYAQRQDFGPDDLVPVVIDDREVARLKVRDLLP